MKIKLPYKIQRNDQGFVTRENEGRRYVYGISSGPKEDSHGTTATPETIKQFHEQAQSKNIKLFAHDEHESSSLLDIGILTGSKILDDGSWWTEFRLYDEDDPVDRESKEISNKLWLQLNGLPPYNHPEDFGFSIDGRGKIMKVNGREYLSDIDLDGVYVVKHPSYSESTVMAIQRHFSSGQRYEGVSARQYFNDLWALQDEFIKSVEKHVKKHGRMAKDRIMRDGQSFISKMAEMASNNQQLFVEDEAVTAQKIKMVYRENVLAKDRLQRSDQSKNEIQIKKTRQEHLVKSLKALASELNGATKILKS